MEVSGRLVNGQDKNRQEMEEEDEQEMPLEIGIEEVSFLRDCIQKKLLLLEATQER